MSASSNDYIPRRENDLKGWARNMSLSLSESPEEFGITAAMAAQYAAVLQDFEVKLQRAFDPGTRTSVAVLEKNEAKRELIKQSRILAQYIQATPGMTDLERERLRLTLRDAEATRVPPPAHAPAVDVVNVNGQRVRVRLRDPENRTRRGRPDGVTGAAVFSRVGDNPPSDVGAWTLQGITSKTRVTLAFGSNVGPGTPVWLCAYWVNQRGEGGPVSKPVMTYTLGGLQLAEGMMRSSRRDGVLRRAA